MPLKPMPNGKVERVEVEYKDDNGVTQICWYDIKAAVNVEQEETSRFYLMESAMQLRRAQSLMSKLASGDGDGNTRDFEKAIKAGNDCVIDLIEMWIKDWSHDDKLCRENLKRLDANDMNAIAERIKALLDIMQGISQDNAEKKDLTAISEHSTDS